MVTLNVKPWTIRDEPGLALSVRARRCLDDPDEAERLLSELANVIEKRRESSENKRVDILEVDLAQNAMSVQHMEQLFDTLKLGSAAVDRFRLWGMQTMGDDAVSHLASYLQQADVAPTELHLADCAISDIGFQELLESIECNPAFPKKTAQGKFTPMFLRIENNFIADEVIEAKAKAHCIQVIPKTASKPALFEDTIKVRLLQIRTKTSLYSQLGGTPLDPGSVVPPRPGQKGKSGVPKDISRESAQSIGADAKTENIGGVEMQQIPMELFSALTSMAAKKAAMEHMQQPATTTKSKGGAVASRAGKPLLQPNAASLFGGPAGAAQPVSSTAPARSGALPTPKATGAPAKRPLAGSALSGKPSKAPRVDVKQERVDVKQDDCDAKQELEEEQDQERRPWRRPVHQFLRPNISDRQQPLDRQPPHRPMPRPHGKTVQRATTPPREQPGAPSKQAGAATRGTFARPAHRAEARPTLGKLGVLSPLPAGWEAHWSEDHGLPYYWNPDTAESSWIRPTP